MATATGPVTVASYGSAAEAESSRALLGEAGIPSVVAGSAGEAGEFALLVERPDVGRAIEILRARAAEEAAADGPEALLEDEGDVACMACAARIPEYLERCPACGWSSA